MWLFTTYGFFSVVCARQGNGDINQPVDPNMIMVRARKKIHLKNLIARFPQLSPFKILDKEDTDYRFRIFVPKSIWAEIAKELAEEIDYDNFKGKVKEKDMDIEYCRSLGSVWYTMYQIQERDLFI